jgi:pimeloyl-ACP methyl ester carboxylesterase
LLGEHVIELGLETVTSRGHECLPVEERDTFFQIAAVIVLPPGRRGGAAMPSGLGTVAMVEGAGHCPHAQSPDQVAALIIPFLKEHARA